MIKSLIIIYIFFLGITGTWEGWVPVATDLYLRGHNVAGWTYGSYVEFHSGGIYANLENNSKNETEIVTTKAYNLSPYNYLNVEYYLIHGYMDREVTVMLTLTCNDYSSAGRIYQYCPKDVSTILSLSLKTISYTANKMKLGLRGFSKNDTNTGYSMTGYIYRIWLS